MHKRGFHVKKAPCAAAAAAAAAVSYSSIIVSRVIVRKYLFDILTTALIGESKS